MKNFTKRTHNFQNNNTVDPSQEDALSLRDVVLLNTREELSIPEKVHRVRNQVVAMFPEVEDVVRRLCVGAISVYRLGLGR